MRDDLGVGARLAADAAVGLEPVAELGGVDHVAVVRERELDGVAADVDGLSVERAARARGRVPGMADGDVPRQSLDVLLAEGVGHEADVGEGAEDGAVSGGDAGGLLSAVLEGEDAVEGDLGGVAADAVGEVCADYPARLTREIQRRSNLQLALGQADLPSSMDWRGERGTDTPFIPHPPPKGHTPSDGNIAEMRNAPSLPPVGGISPTGWGRD